MRETGSAVAVLAVVAANVQRRVEAHIARWTQAVHVPRVEARDSAAGTDVGAGHMKDMLTLPARILAVGVRTPGRVARFAEVDGRTLEEAGGSSTQHGADTSSTAHILSH